MIIRWKIERQDYVIGLYWRRDYAGVLSWYICLLPTFLILLEFTHKCEKRGCKQRGYECRYDGWSTKADYHYCPNQMQEEGFCYLCGLFWAGNESFDFGPGYCSNCAPEVEEAY